MSGLAAADGAGDGFEAVADGVGDLPPAVAVGADEVVALPVRFGGLGRDVVDLFVDADEQYVHVVDPLGDVPFVHVTQGSWLW